MISKSLVPSNGAIHKTQGLWLECYFHCGTQFSTVTWRRFFSLLIFPVSSSCIKVAGRVTCQDSCSQQELTEPGTGFVRAEKWSFSPQIPYEELLLCPVSLMDTELRHSSSHPAGGKTSLHF